ncbi:ATP-binding protein (plasmid) [Streptomyces sp. NBC_00111]|uniref:ATP-binding protein n=1 Tax=unclassified Streptomyces TaxID=2593676 RepID=UPI002E31EB01|nr:ATP-binding protein [Streptomyces sp. NBC_01460]
MSTTMNTRAGSTAGTCLTSASAAYAEGGADAEPRASVEPHHTAGAMTVTFTITPLNGRLAPRDQDARHIADLRHLVRGRLTSWGLSVLADDAELIVSELLTNSLIHSGGTRVDLDVRIEGDRLRIEVGDGARRPPCRPAHPCDEAENGRGLEIVHFLVQARGGAWGLGPDGTHTWCTLAIGTGGAR